MSISIERVFSTQFPNDIPLSVERLSRGIGNENYKIIYQNRNSSDNHQIIITVFPEENSKWKVKKELLVRQTIGNLNIPLPKISTASTEYSCDGIPPYIIREYIEGLDIDEFLETHIDDFSERDRRLMTITMGDILGKLHKIELPAFGKLEDVLNESSMRTTEKNKMFPSWEKFFHYLLYEEISKTGLLDNDATIGNIRAEDIKNLIPQIKKYYSDNNHFLLSVSQAKFCHNDTRLGNFIAKKSENGWELGAIIDFEWAFAGDPDIDLVYLENWLHFASYRKNVRTSIPEFLVGYEPHRKISINYPQKRPLYHLYRSLSYLNAVFSRNTKEFLKNNPRGEIYVATHIHLLKNILSGKFNIPCVYTRWEANNGINPEAQINIEPVNRLLAKHLNHKEKYQIRIGNIILEIHPDVFNPAYTNTSTFLAENINISRGASVLDMFSGSGYQAIRAADIASKVVAIDHSPKAIACIKENIELNRVSDKITVIQSDLFSALTKGKDKFDLIIANPPLLPGIPLTLLETAVYDPELETNKRFLNQVGDYLNPGGKIFLLFTDAGEKINVGGLKFIEEICRKNNLKTRVIARKFVGYETYLIIEITNNN